MKIKIKYYKNTIAEEWDEYVLRSINSTFCHLIGWKNVIEKTFGHKSHYIYAESDEKICGILPLFLVTSVVFGKFFISTPFAVYGGICADSTEAENLLFEHAKKMAEELAVDYLEFRNIQDSNCDLPKSELYVTFLQELFNDDLEKNWNTMPRETRRLVRKAKSAGLKSTIECDHLDKFYDVYSRSVKNLGTPVFPKKLFKNFLDEFPDNSNMLHVWHEDKIIASVFNFYFQETILPYYGGALSEYNNNKFAPNNFMYWELMKYGIDNGYKIFDFGRSKIGTGAYNFKRHFGMEPTPLHYKYYLVKRNELPNLNPTNPKYKILIDTWKKLPIGIANLIGPHIVKYIP